MDDVIDMPHLVVWCEHVYMQPDVLPTEDVRHCVFINLLHRADGEDDTAAEVEQAADSVILTICSMQKTGEQSSLLFCGHGSTRSTSAA